MNFLEYYKYSCYNFNIHHISILRQVKVLQNNLNKLAQLYDNN